MYVGLHKFSFIVLYGTDIGHDKIQRNATLLIDSTTLSSYIAS